VIKTNNTVITRLINCRWKSINEVVVSDINSVSYFVLWILHGSSDQQGNGRYVMDSCQLWTLHRNWTGNQLHKTDTLMKRWYSFNCPKRISSFKKVDNLIEPNILVCPELVQSSPHFRIKCLSVYHTICFIYFSFRFSWLDSPSGCRVHPCRSLVTTLRHTTLGRASLDEWSLLRTDLYLLTHNTHKRQTSMSGTDSNPQF